MNINRRRALALAVSALGAPAIIQSAAAAEASPGLQAAVGRFSSLPGTSSCLVVAGHPEVRWQVGHNPGTRLFIASAFKTFVLAQFLREVEAGRLSEETQEAIDDAVRTQGSAVFVNLTGTTTARSVLEAMITHSDNTAADIALAAAGPDRVRALITEAGLTKTQIPDSTRRMVSYLVGAPEGVDIGWEGEKRMAKGESFGKPRPAINDRQSMVSTADEMVRWYQQALAGTFFKKPQTLVEFKRIQAMADAIATVAPSNTVTYAKGGSIDFDGFHARCLPGQMIVSGVPITFCTTINWTGPDDTVAATFQAYVAAVANVLQEAARSVG
ncbi:serine hydrolase [Chelatococcus sp. GCM10030263]|uniref:serine hydrolase n=1 Tax=Chelatococcus sp. GCM10030263 TaxID=3273387 RepID=UPI00361F8DF2